MQDIFNKQGAVIDCPLLIVKKDLLAHHALAGVSWGLAEIFTVALGEIAVRGEAYIVAYFGHGGVGSLQDLFGGFEAADAEQIGRRVVGQSFELSVKLHSA